MKIVLLVGHTPEGEVQHRYVARRLHEIFGEDLKAIIVADAPTKPLLARVRRHWRRHTIRELFSRILFRSAHALTGRHRTRQAALARVLFPAGEDGSMPGGDILKVVESHNGRDCLDLLSRIQPDVIAVYGTLIIGRQVIARAGKSIINMHTGLSPRYRGSDTIFWPLHNREPEWVGVTIHRLTSGVDAGPILATARPAIDEGDDEDSLFAKSVAIGCEHFVHAIRAEAEGTATALPQDLSEGREYRSAERTVAAERRVRRLLANGMLASYVGRNRA